MLVIDPKVELGAGRSGCFHVGKKSAGAVVPLLTCSGRVNAECAEALVGCPLLLPEPSRDTDHRTKCCTNLTKSVEEASGLPVIENHQNDFKSLAFGNVIDAGYVYYILPSAPLDSLMSS